MQFILRVDVWKCYRIKRKWNLLILSQDRGGRFEDGMTHLFPYSKSKGLRGFTAAVDTVPLSCRHFKQLRKRHEATPKRLSNQMSQDLHGNIEAIQPSAKPAKKAKASTSRGLFFLSIKPPSPLFGVDQAALEFNKGWGFIFFISEESNNDGK